jgi:hypothetical protein
MSGPENLAERTEIDRVLRDPAASHWLTESLRSALVRDPVDAANDSAVLAQLLERRCRAILTRDETVA